MSLLNRRRFVAALAAAPAFAQARSGEARVLQFSHLHTGETLEVEYFAAGRYLPDALGAVNHLLRDFRSGDVGTMDPALLDHERENNLLGLLAGFPRVVASAAELREPHRVARYLEDLATAYHRFYDVCWVLPRGDEELAPIHVARLWLCAASRQTLANGLDLLGVSAPDRM